MVILLPNPKTNQNLCELPWSGGVWRCLQSPELHLSMCSTCLTLVWLICLTPVSCQKLAFAPLVSLEHLSCFLATLQRAFNMR